MGGAARRRCNRATAAPVSEGICAFCGSSDQDETTIGKLYQLETIIVHYYCALVSCGLFQRGGDEEGLFGFLVDDILTELQRGKKLKCSYCGCYGATVGCCVSACKKSFHLPCGRKRGARSVFYGDYKTFCTAHVKKQKIPESVLAKALVRQARGRAKIAVTDGDEQQCEGEEATCAICYDCVDAWPSVDTFWPPCCARDRWLHTVCLQRMALSAGIHYLKCPLCNDKDTFQVAAQEHGVFIPDRDAAWELENDAFAELYERPRECSAANCLCYRGRGYDADEGDWELKMCLTCGSEAAHAGCLPGKRLICERCGTVPPPGDLDALERIPLVRAENDTPEFRPLMTHRMSIRRTKAAQSSKDFHKTFKAERIVRIHKENDVDEDVDVETIERAASTSSGNDSILRQLLRGDTLYGRAELGIGPVEKRQTNGDVERDESDGRVGMDEGTDMLSPLKMLENEIYDRITGRDDPALRTTVETSILKMRRPGPLSRKKRAAGRILDNINECEERSNQQIINSSLIEENVANETIAKDVVSAFCDDSLGHSVAEVTPANNDSSSKENSNVDIFTDTIFDKTTHEAVDNDRLIDETEIVRNDCSSVAKKLLKFKKYESNYKLSIKPNVKHKTDDELEMLKFRYLSEVRRNAFQCSFNHKHGNVDTAKYRLKSAIDFAIEAAMTNTSKAQVKNTENENMSHDSRIEDSNGEVSENNSLSQEEIEIISPMHNEVAEPEKDLNPLMKLQRGIDKVNEVFDKCKAASNADKRRKKIKILENVVLVQENTSTNAKEIMDECTNEPIENQNTANKNQKENHEQSKRQHTNELIQYKNTADDNQNKSKIQSKKLLSASKQNNSEQTSRKKNRNKKLFKNKVFKIRLAVHRAYKDEPVASKNNILTAMRSTFDTTDISSLMSCDEDNIEGEPVEESDPEKYFLLKDMKSKFKSVDINPADLYDDDDSEYTHLIKDTLVEELTSNRRKNLNLEQIKEDLRNIERQRRRNMNVIKIKFKPERKVKKEMKRKNRDEFIEVAKKRKIKDGYIDNTKKRKIVTAKITTSIKNDKKSDEIRIEKKKQSRKRRAENCAENGFVDETSSLDDFYIKIHNERKDKQCPALKQSVLNFSQSNKPVSNKEEKSPPAKKRRKKMHESPDGLKQTTLNSFFSQTTTTK